MGCMKRILEFWSQEFCIWMVPSSDGRVRKIRLTLRSALVAPLAALLLVLALVFVAGDYTRIQVERFHERHHAHKLDKTNRELFAVKDRLTRELQSYKESHLHVSAYHAEVKARIEELESILESASKAGGLPFEEAFEGAPLGIGGDDEQILDSVGGAEIDCPPEGCREEGVRFVPSSYYPRGGSLAEDLDRLISVLSTLPLGYPVNGFVNSPYGPRRSPFSGRMRLHQGIDIAMPTGSRVLSTADGTVHSVKRSRAYGLVVDIEHENGIVTRYAHLSDTFVAEGETICRGEVLGLVGSTGYSTGPHLHYEVRVNDKAIDPERVTRLASRLRETISRATNIL